MNIDFCINNLISPLLAVSNCKLQWSHNEMTIKYLHHKIESRHKAWPKLNSVVSSGGWVLKGYFYFQLLSGPEKAGEKKRLHYQSTKNTTCLFSCFKMSAKYCHSTHSWSELIKWDNEVPVSFHISSSPRPQTLCPSQIIISTLLTDNIVLTNPLTDTQSIRLDQLQMTILI